MQPIRLDKESIIKALENDAAFFINFFMGDLLTTDIPELHPELFNLMCNEDINQLVLAVPRSHAKTTLAKLAAVRYFQFTDYKFILYMSNTFGVSVPCVNDIIAFFESDNYISVFGEVEFIFRREGKGEYKFILANGKICILKAFSAGMQVRGINIDNTRPQLKIVDDLEDNINIGTKELFDGLKRWYYGPFKKCADPLKNKTIWIGNLINERSMLYENINSQFWHSRLYGCIKEDGDVLWPGIWSIEKLKQDFAEYEAIGMADVWFAEMMNMPMAGINGIIQASEIQYAPRLSMGEENVIGFITLDLATSKEEWAHSTVIAVHVYNDDVECFQVVETEEFKGSDPVTLFPKVINACQRWNIYVVGIESVAYQATVQPIFEHFCLQQNIHGMEFVLIPARTQKFLRLLAWTGMIKDGSYKLTEGDFGITQQLLAYDVKKKENVDDIIDACAHGVYMIKHESRKIFNKSRDKLIGKVDSGMQSSYHISRF